MKIPIFILVFLAFIVNGVGAQSPTTQSQITAPVPTPYLIINQDANCRDWQRLEFESGPNGDVITHVRAYNEISKGGSR
jgi:hypothetical protein